MTLSPGCPRCQDRLESPDADCRRHGNQPVLWRPDTASYESFADHLLRADGFPTYLPWPMASGWRLSDFGVVIDRSGRPVASLTCSTGSTEFDGRVDVLIVAEEVGVGLGGRCAGLAGADPGSDFGQGLPAARIRIGSQGIALWLVSTSTSAGELDRSVVAGEADGRWLWLILHPAPSLLLLGEEWVLRDVSGEGPHLVELPIEGPAPLW